MNYQWLIETDVPHLLPQPLPFPDDNEVEPITFAELVHAYHGHARTIIWRSRIIPWPN